MSRGGSPPDSGAGTVWVLLVAALVWVAGTWFVTLSGVAGERASAGAAADLSALAGAAHIGEGRSAACDAAGQVAVANSAVLRRCDADELASTVAVVVEVHGTGLLAHTPPAIGRARAGPAPDG